MSDFEVPEFFKETYRQIGQTLERLRILDILANSNIDKQTLEEIRKQIKA